MELAGRATGPYGGASGRTGRHRRGSTALGIGWARHRRPAAGVIGRWGVARRAIATDHATSDIAQRIDGPLLQRWIATGCRLTAGWSRTAGWSPTGWSPTSGSPATGWGPTACGWCSTLAAHRLHRLGGQRSRLGGQGSRLGGDVLDRFQRATGLAASRLTLRRSGRRYAEKRACQKPAQRTWTNHSSTGCCFHGTSLRHLSVTG
jgi:hypothetical protein